jgi:hypothetical protein
VRTTACYRCGANVWMGETERGKIVAVNAWHAPSGPVVAIDPEADRPMVRWVKKGEELPPGTRRYLLHMITCKPAGRKAR